MSKTALQLLIDARERLKDHWSCGAMARDSEHIPITPWDPHACMWCAVGAILCEAGPSDSANDLYDVEAQPTNVQDALALLSKYSVYPNQENELDTLHHVTATNDTRPSVVEVLAWFDLTILSLKGKEDNEQNSPTASN